MAGSVIVAGARTPIGRFQGALGSFKATELGSLAIAAALERSGITPDEVDYVYMGQVLQAGAGQIAARQAATGAGIPMTTPSTTINKVCLSGLNTIILADQLIAAGAAEVVVAGGMEEVAARSHERAAAAHKDGRVDAGLVPVPVPQRRGGPVLVDHDEGIRP